MQTLLQMELYKAISCDTYDQYVLWQMRKTDLVLKERTSSQKHQGRILDIYTRDGAEYLAFSDGFTYRLDQIQIEPKF